MVDVLPAPLTDTSAAGLRRAIEADNVATRLFNTDLPVEAHDEADASWAVGPRGDILRSVVVRAYLAESAAERRIDEIIASYDPQGGGVVWWVAPFHTPRDLAARLERRGFVHYGESAGMALDLSSRPARIPTIDGFTIEPVRDKATAGEYVAVIHEDRPEGVPPYLPEHTQLTVDSVAARVAHQPFPTYFLGRLGGRAVATSRLSLVAGTAGIYAVVTLGEARGRGIGSAMTLAALHAARDRGYRIATLQSSDMGHAIYRRLGFIDAFTYGIHVHPPAGVAVPSPGDNA
jgi:GNAT superfamily N-acetyltransferase